MENQGTQADGPLTILLATITGFLSSCFTGIGPRLRRLMYWLGGIDRRVLATCPKSEQTFHTAIPLVMLIAALATGAGVAYKAFAFGPIVVGLIFVTTFIFALALEAAVLGTLKVGSKIVWAMGARVLVGGMLVSLQATPIQTELLREQIALFLFNQHITNQLDAKAKAEILLNPKTLEAKAEHLATVRNKAAADQAQPPADPLVSQAEKALAMATDTHKRAVADTKVAESKVHESRLALARADSEEDRSKFALRLVKAEAARQNRLQRQNKTDAEAINAKTDLDAAKLAQTQRLADASASAIKAHAQHADRLVNVESEVKAMQEQSTKLSEAATRSNPATQIVALFRLAVSDAYVGLVCAAIFFGFALLDLLPSILKVASAKNVYSMAMKSREDSQIAALNAQRNLEDIEHSKVIALEKNQLDAVESYVAQDRGALESEKLLLRAQADVDDLSTASSINATFSALERLGQLQDILILQEEKNKAHPEVAAVYASQLTTLLADLQAKAQKLSADLTATVVGGVNAPQPGTGRA